MNEKEKFVEFESYAVPHSWFLLANELHDQAKGIFLKKGDSLLKCSGKGSVAKTTDLANRSAFLLGGFALENAIKAFLVYENPNWISGGKLSKNLISHSLSKLAKKSNLIPWPKKGQTVLKVFESGLNSWARYPCPIKINQVTQEMYFTDELWVQYVLQMERYFKELKTLLKKEWKGPHEFEGRYTFSEHF